MLEWLVADWVVLDPAKGPVLDTVVVLLEARVGAWVVLEYPVVDVGVFNSVIGPVVDAVVLPEARIMDSVAFPEARIMDSVVLEYPVVDCVILDSEGDNVAVVEEPVVD